MATGILMLAGLVLTQAEAQQPDVECNLAVKAIPIHLAPGASAEVRLAVELSTDPAGSLFVPFEWFLGDSRLGTAVPRTGALFFATEVNDGAMHHSAPVPFTFTAGQRAGSEVVPLRIVSTERDDVPASCRGIEIPVPVTVGGDWALSSEISSEGPVSVAGALSGSFSVAPGNRVEGSGIARTVVSGRCVRGVQEEPFRIEGTVTDDVMRFTILTDWDREPREPDVEMDESMECAIRTLRELPTVMRTLIEWGMRGLASDACPMDVPLDALVHEPKCGGLEYRVERLAP